MISASRNPSAVGVLALQGSVAPHLAALEALGVSAISVRKPATLDQVDRLIVPGGESTALWRLLCHAQLWEPIGARAASGDLALFGTCAGAILLGRETQSEPPPRWGIVQVTVDRNAYGNQVDSFIGPIDYRIAPLTQGAVGEPNGGVLSPSGAHHGANHGANHGAEGVFIRAPRFRDPGPAVQVLAERAGEPIALRQERVIIATFHPELSTDRRLHRLFLDL